MTLHIGASVPRPVDIPPWMTAYQMTVSSLSSSDFPQPVPSSEREKIRTYTSQGISGCIHGKYIYNFCRKASTGDQSLLLEELSLASSLGLPLVIHQGKNLESLCQSKLEAVDNFVTAVTRVLEAVPEGVILLENSAGQGTELGSKYQEYSYIFRKFEGHPRLGICFDTCHSFVAGDLDLRREDLTREYFDQFDQDIGLNNLKVIHLNDSRVRWQSRADRHEELGKGYIANPDLGGSPDGLRYLTRLAGQRGIPLILETPGDHFRQSRLVVDWTD